MAAYHFGYHDYPLDAAECPVCRENAEAEGEQEAIAADEREAERAYQDGVRDRRESRDDGVDRWETSRYHEDYARGWFEEHARSSEVDR